MEVERGERAARTKLQKAEYNKRTWPYHNCWKRADAVAAGLEIVSMATSTQKCNFHVWWWSCGRVSKQIQHLLMKRELLNGVTLDREVFLLLNLPSLSLQRLDKIIETPVNRTCGKLDFSLGSWIYDLHLLSNRTAFEVCYNTTASQSGRHRAVQWEKPQEKFLLTINDETLQCETTLFNLTMTISKYSIFSFLSHHAS